MNIVEKIISNFVNNKSLYIGEKVTMTEHMIQSAMLAEKNKSSSSLICASLLHDYGHFILDNPDKLVNQKEDGKHEDVAYRYLKKYFKKNVVEPIKIHVKAKRYLARNQKYYRILSQASKVSLHLQGGVMNDEESEKFKKEKFFDDAIKLRKFDEAAKKIGIKMKNINNYKSLLNSNLL
jgi:predicted HD phosphohydrolase